MKDNNFYYDSVYETPESRMEKRKKQSSFFSRIFLGLCIYILCFNFIPTVIFIIAQIVMSNEDYAALISNTTIVTLVSSAAQYLIAFPIFFLITKDMTTSEKKEKKALSLSEGVILFSIAEVLMFVGNMIGNFFNTVIGTLIQNDPENGIAEILENTPVWLTFVVVVVIAPIVEEVIFRKILIDRLSIYGDRVAIIFSAVAFGLMHANLYQLFYATLIGALLGYVYTSTRDVKHTIGIHAAANFFGGTLPLLVNRTGDYLSKLTSDAQLISIAEELTSSLYVNVQAGLLMAGIVAIMYRYKNRQITISNDAEVYIPMKDMARGGIVNSGSITFIVISLALTILNLFN